jgi:hypothetical protein
MQRCVICHDPKKKDWVARRHLEGHSAARMESLSREQGITVKRETITKHLRTCLALPPEVTPKQVAAMAESMPRSHDVATLVQQQVIEKLQAGEARVTVQHGLQAQQLLDRRAERQKDRELAVTLARLLHSPMPPVALVQERAEVIIEGEAVEV